MDQVIENDDRKAMYEKFNQGKEPPKKEVKDPKISDAPPAAGATGTPPAKEEASPAEKGVREPETPAKQTEVPHAALHAEREKRKALEQKVKELEDQQQTLLGDLQKLMEKPAEEKPIEDYEKAIRDLQKENESQKREIQVLKTDSQKRAEYEKAEETRKNQSIRNGRVAEADAKLAKEGFPGFSKFTSLVGDELRKRVQNGESPEDVDTPEVWMRVYRESVFPQVRELFISEKFKEKEEKKKDATLVTGSGGAPKGDEKKGQWTLQDYWKMRQGSQT